MTKSALALFGGPKVVMSNPKDIFTWPIVTDEDRRAILDVLNRGAMSQLDVTREFEKEFAAWQGTKHALAHSTGTASIEGALFGCQVGRSDEIICPSLTYWASALPAYNLGATGNAGRPRAPIPGTSAAWDRPSRPGPTPVVRRNAPFA